MAVNKVEFGDTTLIDLTEDTVTPETLAAGVTAHASDGTQITGTFVLPSNLAYLEEADEEINLPDIQHVNKTGDTMTGPLTLSGDPTEDLHAATKQYVDNIVGNVEALLQEI